MNQYYLTQSTLFYRVLVSPNPLKACRHAFQWTHCVISVRPIKAWSNACNISTQHLTLLHDVATCVERAGETHAPFSTQQCVAGPWYATSGPSTDALVQQCRVNVAKQVQHRTTSKMLYEKFDRYEIWSNSIQHFARYCNRVTNVCNVVPNNVARCCAEMLQVFGQVFSEHADNAIKLLGWNCLTLLAMVQLYLLHFVSVRA